MPDTRGLPASGPHIFTHPLHGSEGATAEPTPSVATPPHPTPLGAGGTTGHGNTHSGTGKGAHHTRGSEQQRRRCNIATSRTGTATWKRIREQAIKRALENGVHNCPICGVGLDYEYSQRPNSAEVDHIVPWSKGGTDTLDNTTVICRWDNIRKGNGRNLTVPQPKTIEPGTSIEW